MLPEGWRIASVDAVCETVSVGIVVNPSHYYVAEKEGTLAFRSGNVRENSVLDEKWVYLSPEGHAKNRKSELRGGDVLVVRTGFAGAACVLPARYAGSNCIDIIFARPDQTQVLPEYLAQLTNSEIGRRQILAGQSGLAQKHLNVATYAAMQFGLPPVPEQRKIAEILSTWDKAIAAAERSMNCGTKQSRSLLTQILKGKCRLKRSETAHSASTHRDLIPRDWRYLRIGDVAEEVSQKLGGNAKLPVLSCTKHQGLVDSLSYFKKQVFSLDTSTYKIVPRGCFVYATNHIEEGSIGFQDLYDAGLVSPMYTVFKTNDQICAAYLYALLKTEDYRQVFASATNASVDRRGSLRWKDFQKIHIPVPPLPEQRKIGELIDVARRESEVLRRRVAVLRKEKSALMAQLLTGRRRVRIPDAKVTA